MDRSSLGLFAASIALWSSSVEAAPCTGPCRLLKSLPRCEVPVASAFDRNTIFPPGGDSDRYAAPTDDQLDAFERSLRAAVAGDRDAWGRAFEAGYLLCARPNEDTLLWRPAIAGSGWAIVALRVDNARPLIFEVPHPIYDSGTLRQGRYAYGSLKARALVASGTHRCANAGFTLCEGFTRVCSERLERYRESDVAHSERAMFHAAHRVLSDAFRDAAIISLHGMGDDGISLSDGTTIATSSTSRVARLLFALEDAFELDLVTACNEAPGAAVSAHLCGTTNIQGRYTNGLSESCVGTATASSDRFFHVEQSKAVRRKYRRVVRAIGKALAADAVSRPP
ncbi:MAG: hypothetical protein RIT81_47375 [Deltaproteobacteria bacterium]